MTISGSGWITLLALAAAPAGAPSLSDFRGAWTITRSSTPAWITTPMEANRAIVGQRVSFEDDSVGGPGPIGCGNATYEIVESPPQGLFQGYLAEPGAAADAVRELHLSATSAPTLRVNCDTGSFDYHLDERGGLVIMLDNVLYHLTRGGKPAAQ